MYNVEISNTKFFEYIKTLNLPDDVYAELVLALQAYLTEQVADQVAAAHSKKEMLSFVDYVKKKNISDSKASLMLLKSFEKKTGKTADDIVNEILDSILQSCLKSAEVIRSYAKEFIDGKVSPDQVLNKIVGIT